jgi:hypothetical protein
VNVKAILKNLFPCRGTESCGDEEDPATSTTGTAQRTRTPTNSTLTPTESDGSNAHESTSSNLEFGELDDDRSAPNISLNLHDSNTSRELYVAAFCGIVLQFGMLVFCGFSVYHPAFSQRFLKNGRSVPGYAFPTMATGTILLVIGMLICSAVVEQSTEERIYELERKTASQPRESDGPDTATGEHNTDEGIHELTQVPRQNESQPPHIGSSDNQTDSSNDSGKEPKVRVLWLQKSHTVSDQVFESFVLFGSYRSGPRDYILTSRRWKNSKTRSPSSTSDSVAGSHSSSPDAADRSRSSSPNSAHRSSSSNLNSAHGPLPSCPKSKQWTRITTIASDPTQALTLLGVFLGLSGFVLQFQGLRGMNWSASIAQLVCTFLMTLWRAWVRRSMVAMPIAHQVSKQHELDWLALRMAKFHGQSESGGFWPKDEEYFKSGQPKDLSTRMTDTSVRMSWEIFTDRENLAYRGYFTPINSATSASPAVTASAPTSASVSASAPAIASASKTAIASESPSINYSFSVTECALQIRKRLGRLTNWTGPLSPVSIALAESIEVAMEKLLDKEVGGLFTWFVSVKVNNEDEKVKFTIEKRDDRWKIDTTSIEAALSLWTFHIRAIEAERKEKTNKKEAPEDWLRDDTEMKRRIIRLLGPADSTSGPADSSKGLPRSLRWWMGETVGDVRGKDKDNDQHNNEGTGLVVGFMGLNSNDENHEGNSYYSRRFHSRHTRRKFRGHSRNPIGGTRNNLF